MFLTILLENQAKVCMSSQLLFFISLTHHTCLDPKNDGKDETAWPKETEKHCDDSGWKIN